MKKHYIAPSLTVVAIHVERGYADSLRASANDVALDLTDFKANCSGSTPEERAVSTNWTVDNADNAAGFWGSGGF